ncbi:MAG: TolC family protein [Blastocatellia bacterium]|nr:TolC family protein [Blastocatellia bacterium]
MLLISSAAMAQTPAPPQQQPAQQQTTLPSPESPPIPERTLGLEPGKVVQWTLKDAILAALENNVDIEAQKSNVRTAQWNILAAQGVYDPTQTTKIGYQTNTQANTFQFSGTNSPIQSTNEYSYGVGISQLFEKTGGSYNVTFNNARDASNTQNLAVNYVPSLNFQITQPIFRNFKTDPNRNQIKLRKKALDISDAQFRQTVIQIITNVMTAYWQLYIAYENEKITRSSLALAEKQLSDNKRQVEVGTLPPIDIIQAAALVEGDRASVYSAINQVAAAENALKLLVVDGPNSDLWKTKIETIQKFEISNVQLPLDDAINLAYANRFELKGYNLQKEYNQINIDFYRNQLKPQIDFVAGYTLYGVGGRVRADIPTCSPDTPPGIQCVQQGFVGGYGTSLSNLFSNNYKSWSIGLNINLPIRNRIAKANLAIARESDKNNDLAIRRQTQAIEQQVRNALQSVDTARQRVETTGKASYYAELQYEGAQKKLTAGLATVFEVLTRQNDLVNAQVQENQAKSDYAQAVANLQMVLSTTDVENGIQIPDPKQPIK